MSEGVQRVIDPTDAFDVHLGMTVYDASDAIIQGVLHSAGVLGHTRREVFVDGDGWNAWGEAPYVDGNDGEHLHVVVRLLSLSDAIGFVERLLGGGTAGQGAYPHLLEPMTSEADRGVVAVVTSAADWSCTFYVVTSNGIHRTIANEVRR